jgi:hypothetical protein
MLNITNKNKFKNFICFTLQTTLVVTSVKPVEAQSENFPDEFTKPMMVLLLRKRNCLLTLVTPFTTNLEPAIVDLKF